MALSREPVLLWLAGTSTDDMSWQTVLALPFSAKKEGVSRIEQALSKKIKGLRVQEILTDTLESRHASAAGTFLQTLFQIQPLSVFSIGWKTGSALQEKEAGQKLGALLQKQFPGQPFELYYQADSIRSGHAGTWLKKKGLQGKALSDGQASMHQAADLVCFLQAQANPVLEDVQKKLRDHIRLYDSWQLVRGQDLLLEKLPASEKKKARKLLETYPAMGAATENWVKKQPISAGELEILRQLLDQQADAQVLARWMPGKIEEKARQWMESLSKDSLYDAVQADFVQELASQGLLLAQSLGASADETLKARLEERAGDILKQAIENKASFASLPKKSRQRSRLELKENGFVYWEEGRAGALLSFAALPLFFEQASRMHGLHIQVEAEEYEYLLRISLESNAKIHMVPISEDFALLPVSGRWHPQTEILQSASIRKWLPDSLHARLREEDYCRLADSGLSVTMLARVARALAGGLDWQRLQRRIDSEDVMSVQRLLLSYLYSSRQQQWLKQQMPLRTEKEYLLLSDPSLTLSKMEQLAAWLDEKIDPDWLKANVRSSMSLKQRENAVSKFPFGYLPETLNQPVHFSDALQEKLVKAGLDSGQLQTLSNNALRLLFADTPQ